MKTKFVLVVAFVFTWIISNCQSSDFIVLPSGDTVYGKSFSLKGDLVNGYVVLQGGDTLFGELRKIDDVKSCSKIEFSDKSKEKIKLKIRNVKLYVRGQEIYMRKRTNTTISGYCYMKKIKGGKIKLYKYDYLFSNSYIDTNGMPITGRNVQKKDYYIEKNKKLFLIRKGSFRKSIVTHFSDNIDLVSRIKKKELTYYDIEEIVEIYNKKEK